MSRMSRSSIIVESFQFRPECFHAPRDTRADGGWGAPEDLGRLGVGEVFVEAQDDRGALSLRQSQERLVHPLV